MVTRGHLSKQAVAAAYERISLAHADDTPPPRGPLDFSSGTAQLRIGGLSFVPLVRTVLRYHGEDYIRLRPGEAEGEPGQISAVFTDDAGRRSLSLESNEWVGATDGWDIQVEGNRLTVRTAPRTPVLILRLEPPTRIVVERLDMRVGDGHVLVGEDAYAVGRYVDDRICWAYARVRFYDPPPEAVAIEFTTPEALELRDQRFRGVGAEMATEGRWCVLNARAGCLFKPLGIAVATMINGFEFIEAAIGVRSLEEVRAAVFYHPEDLARVIGSGERGTSAGRE